ncbi:hypothetical protein [Maricaulis sp.]|uniref:hypothetical protein n=1 Tax=Maricaulis sp. TaxID=1486257 RepID=UPI002B2780DA|nr:hypothetical protein [Maricaulis sp.]
MGEILLEKGVMRLLSAKIMQGSEAALLCAPRLAVCCLSIISITTVMAPSGAMTATT